MAREDLCTPAAAFAQRKNKKRARNYSSYQSQGERGYRLPPNSMVMIQDQTITTLPCFCPLSKPNSPMGVWEAGENVAGEMTPLGREEAFYRRRLAIFCDDSTLLEEEVRALVGRLCG